ncbi:hypothetical protein HJG60_008520 [Phyllostomus discolor]|uniref:Uncharacterized protein n=1 Tax=Phyllostomus discolor TaxID=89673 RepID=A0A833Z0Y3_9CHIR|nr:hypothetical protein HJG60_008520 [Phyllostomus discolor]
MLEASGWPCPSATTDPALRRPPSRRPCALLQSSSLALLTCLSVRSREGAPPYILGATRLPFAPGVLQDPWREQLCSAPSRLRLFSQPHLVKTLPSVIPHREGCVLPPCPGVLCRGGSRLTGPSRGADGSHGLWPCRCGPRAHRATVWCRGLGLSPLPVGQLATCSPHRPPES